MLEFCESYIVFTIAFFLPFLALKAEIPAWFFLTCLRNLGGVFLFCMPVFRLEIMGNIGFGGYILEYLILPNKNYIYIALLMGVVFCFFHKKAEEYFIVLRNRNSNKIKTQKLFTDLKPFAHLSAGIYQSKDVDYQTMTAVKLAVGVIGKMDREMISNIERSLLLKRRQKKTVQKIIADQISQPENYQAIIRSFKRRHAGQYTPANELFRQLGTILKTCKMSEEAITSRAIAVGRALGLTDQDIQIALVGRG